MGQSPEWNDGDIGRGIIPKGPWAIFLIFVKYGNHPELNPSKRLTTMTNTLKETP
jgi:hypothetical protein